MNKGISEKGMRTALAASLSVIITIGMIVALITGVATLLTAERAGAATVTLTISQPTAGSTWVAGKQLPLKVTVTGTTDYVTLYVYLNGTLLTRVFGNYTGKILLPKNLVAGTYNLSVVAVNATYYVEASSYVIINVKEYTVEEPYKVQVTVFTPQESDEFYPDYGYRYYDFRIVVSNSSGIVHPASWKATLILPQSSSTQNITLITYPQTPPYNITEISPGVFEYRLDMLAIETHFGVNGHAPLGPYTLVFEATNDRGQTTVASATITYNRLYDGLITIIMNQTQEVISAMQTLEDNITATIKQQTNYIIDNITSVNDTVNNVALLVISVGQSVNNTVKNSTVALSNLIITQSGYVVANITSLNSTLKLVNATVITKLNNIEGNISSLLNLVNFVNSTLSDLNVSIISNLTALNNTVSTIFNNLTATLAKYNISLSELIVNGTNLLIATIKNSNGSITNLIVQANQTLTNLLNTSASEIIANLTNVYGNITALLSNYNASVTNIIQTAENNIIAEIKASNTSIILKLDAVNASLTNTMVTLANNILTNLTQQLSNYNASLSNLIIDSKNGIIATIQAANTSIITRINAVNTSLSNLVQTSINAINASLSALIESSKNEIIDTVTNDYNSLTQQLANYNASITWYIGNSTSKVLLTINSSKDAIISNIGVAKSVLSTQMTNGFNGVKGLINTKYNSIMNELSKNYKGLVSSITNANNNIVTAIENTGQDIKVYVAGKASDLEGLINMRTGNISKVIVTNVTFLKNYIEELTKEQTGTLNTTMSRSLSAVLNELAKSSSDIKGIIIQKGDAVIGALKGTNMEILLNITSLNATLSKSFEKVINSVANAKGDIELSISKMGDKLSADISVASAQVNSNSDNIRTYGITGASLGAATLAGVVGAIIMMWRRKPT